MNRLALKARRTHGEEGFTLVELVIVMVIIGILAAIAVPIYSNQQKEAHKAGLKSDITGTVASLAVWQQGQGFKAIPTHGTAAGQFETKIRIQSDDNRITLVVYESSTDPDNGRQFCVQGVRSFSPTEVVTYSYNTVSKTMTETSCAKVPDRAAEVLN